MFGQALAGMGGLMAPRGPAAIPESEFRLPKAGMFGSGGGSNVLQAISAALSGYLASRGNPVGMMGLQQMQMARQQALEEAKHQTRRKESFEDWVQQQAWKRANPDPSNPHRWESNDGSLMELGPDGTPKVVYKDPTPRLQAVPNGLGGVMFVNPQDFMGEGRAAPQGVTFTPIEDGGPGPQAPGGFPRPR